MITFPPRRFHPSLPKRNARRYSTTWIPGITFPGTRASVTRPSFTEQLLATRTVPPTAAISRPSRNGRVSRSSASGSMSVSASTAITSGKRDALIAAFSESALPPFSLSRTSRRERERERYSARSGLVAMISG